MVNYNSIQPLEVIKLVPLCTYFNVLSNFLFDNNCSLSLEDINKHIPVVNSWYEYLEKGNDFKKVAELVPRFLKGSDIYGENEDEKIDAIFINMMFEHIISSLVFDKYVSIYGFMINTTRALPTYTPVYQLLQKMQQNLQDAKFLNEDGSESRLSDLAAKKIFNEFILSNFPLLKPSWTLASIDFIYAQAGHRFLRMTREKYIFYDDSPESEQKNLTSQNASMENSTSAAENYGEGKNSTKAESGEAKNSTKAENGEAKNSTEAENGEAKNSTEADSKSLNLQIASEERKIDELIGIALGVEQLVIGEKFNKIGLRIFALPAMLYYVDIHKSKLMGKTDKNIILNGIEWAIAHNTLFKYLQNEFQMLEKHKQESVAYEFHQALHDFKNYSTLARHTVEANCTKTELAENCPETERNCPEAEKTCPETELGGNCPETEKICPETGKTCPEMKLEEKVQDYVKGENVSCSKKELMTLSLLYRIQCETITEKYGQFQLLTIKAAFSKYLKIDWRNVIIYEAEVKEGSRRNRISRQDDLFEFYFRNNRSSEFFALITKTAYEVFLIKESDDAEEFRKMLQVDNSTVFQRDGNTRIKSEEETIENFLYKIVRNKKDIFNYTLYRIGRPENPVEFWEYEAPRLNLFYNCTKEVIESSATKEVMFATEEMEATKEMEARKEIEARKEVKSDSFCLMDRILTTFSPLEVTKIGSKITSLSLLSTAQDFGTSVKTIILRDFIRKAVHLKGPESFGTRSNEFVPESEMADFGKGVLRLIDAGIELAFLIAISGILRLNNLVWKISQVTTNPFESFAKSFEIIHDSLTSELKIVDHVYNYAYVKTLSSKINRGYGYRFIRYDRGEVAQLRSVREFPEQVPVVYELVNGTKIYYFYNQKSGHGDLRVHLKNTIDFTEAEQYQLRIKIQSCVKSCPRMERLKLKRERVRKAVQLIEFGNKNVVDLKYKLSCYFPDDDKTEVPFIRGLMLSRKPMTSFRTETRQISEPKLFFNLKYNVWLDSQVQKIEDVDVRINHLYSPLERKIIENEVDVREIIYQYLRNNLHESLIFEDYYALRNNELYGRGKIRENTDEANRMKIAIYKLAIRQCDDPFEEFDQILYVQESRSLKFAESLKVGGTFTFSGFTSVSDVVEQRELPGDFFILYVLKFEGQRYLRAKLRGFRTEKEVILLPGTKFIIEGKNNSAEYVGKANYTISLRFDYNAQPMMIWQASVMERISKLKENDLKYNTVKDCGLNAKCIPFYK